MHYFRERLGVYFESLPQYKNALQKGECRDRDTETDLCDIPGLRCRINNPLEFLGLYNTHHDACHRNHIPAKVVSYLWFPNHLIDEIPH